jgi:translation initiation factor 1
LTRNSLAESMTRLFAGTPYDQPPKCDRCGALESDCTCPPPPAARIPPAQQVARLSLEKRRKGKVVTVIRGLAAAGNDLPALLSRLKSQCGAGGAQQEDSLEIQGEHVERIRALLGELGYRVKG